MSKTERRSEGRAAGDYLHPESVHPFDYRMLFLGNQASLSRKSNMAKFDTNNGEKNNKETKIVTHFPKEFLTSDRD
jgi:hypothetical protein